MAYIPWLMSFWGNNLFLYNMIRSTFSPLLWITETFGTHYFQGFYISGNKKEQHLWKTFNEVGTEKKTCSIFFPQLILRSKTVVTFLFWFSKFGNWSLDTLDYCLKLSELWIELHLTSSTYFSYNFLWNLFYA